MARTYKIRKFQNGRNQKGEPYINYSLTVPTEIAERLPEDIQYACSMDEKGLHFVPVESTTKPVETPSWAKRANGKAPDSRRERPGTKKPAKT
jgi:hypothetical protein